MSTPTVEIYSTAWCPFCARAKKLLRTKGVDFVEIDLDREPHRREEMLNRSGGRHTVPQIFIDASHVGGCDDLFELDVDGKLDPMLKADA